MERPKTSKGKQSADDIYRQKLELQNKQEDEMERFRSQVKEEEEEERKKIKSKHELNIKSEFFIHPIIL